MKNQKRTVFILGATSTIAQSYARLCSTENCNLILAGRDEARLERCAQDCRARGAGAVSIITSDLSEIAAIADTWRHLETEFGVPDEVLLAYGVLGDLEKLKTDASALAQHINVNFTSAAAWLEAAAAAMERERRGKIVVIGSVAGDRGRQSNYIYGAAKAALEHYVQGLEHRLAKTDVHVSTCLIKPGLVDTAMTDGMDKGGPLWARPDAIASAIRRAVRNDRKVVYTPWFWRFVMTAIQAAPRQVLHRTNL